MLIGSCAATVNWFGLFFPGQWYGMKIVSGRIVFTMYWPAADRWEGSDYRLAVVAPSECAARRVSRPAARTPG